MKRKIKEIYNDYYEEFLIYFNKLCKIAKKYKRKIIYYWNNPKNKFLKVIFNKTTIIYKKFIFSVTKTYENIKSFLLNKENRALKLSLLGIFILLNLIILFNFTSYSIYKNEFNFSLLSAKVGDKYSSMYDYSLLVYIEESNTEGVGSGNYNLTHEIPTYGYSYIGYKCKNDSTLTFNSENNNASVTTNHKDICSIYFDLANKSDISLKIMIEEEVDSNKYKVNNIIPYYGYKYSHYECENNSELKYDETLHSVKISSNNPDYCSIYFRKIAEDVTVQLFVEENSGAGDYINRANIPSNNLYVVNDTKSVCFNKLEERIDSTIEYTDGYIEINANEISYCKVYLDKENE